MENARKSIPRQIRQLLRERGMTQQDLALASGLTQGVISRAADMDYGALTMSTLMRIAVGFGLELEVRFVPKVPKVKAREDDEKLGGFDLVGLSQYTGHEQWWGTE